MDIPTQVTPNSPIQVQLSPFGNFVQYVGDGTKKVIQHVNDTTAQAVANAFSKPVLVDADHSSERGTDTEAYAWITGIHVDQALGIVATIEFTDIGAIAVNNKRYRYLSPAWLVDNDGNVERLVSVGLTNKPNLPVRTILNHEDARKLEEQTKEPHTPADKLKEEDENHMDKIAVALGLKADAKEEEILSAISGMKDSIAKAAEEKKDAEAEAFAVANEQYCDREVLKNSFKQSPDVARTLVENVRKMADAKPKTKQVALVGNPVINSADAQPPTPMKSIAEAIKGMTPAEANQFILKNY